LAISSITCSTSKTGKLHGVLLNDLLKNTSRLFPWLSNAMSAMFKRQAIELNDALRMVDAYAGIPIRLMDMTLAQAVELSHKLNVYAYDAYVIGCAINQRAPILSLDGVLKERARSLNVEVIEVKVK
jgi:predicted nucleic acid-binding protein